LPDFPTSTCADIQGQRQNTTRHTVVQTFLGAASAGMTRNKQCDVFFAGAFIW
jgi:hypothetical protein